MLSFEHRGRLGCLLLLFSLTATTGAMAELQLFSQESGGIVDLEGRTRLEVQGFNGLVSVRASKPGELRYQARGRTNRREERPVDLWLDERTLRFVPNAAAPDEPLILEIAVGSGVSTAIDVSGSSVRASSLGGPLEIRGADLEVDVRTVDGQVQLVLDGGSVLLQDIADQVEVEGKNLELRLQEIKGYVSLDLEDSDVRVIAVEESVSGDLVRSQFNAAGVLGRLELSADGGQVEMNAIRGGCELELDDTPLVLTETGGVTYVR